MEFDYAFGVLLECEIDVVNESFEDFDYAGATDLEFDGVVEKVFCVLAAE
jgi:hypothetical protein